MLSRAIAVVAVCLWSAGATAQDRDAQQIISDQMAAFAAGDMDMAFTYASPGIQRQFGTPETFGQMVEQGYPMVWRPAEVLFLDDRTEGGALVQRVMITDQGGRVHVLDYYMQTDGSGLRIGGVRIVPAPGVGA